MSDNNRLAANCNRSVNISSKLTLPEYIFDIRASYHGNQIFVSASDNSVYLFDYDLNRVFSAPNAHKDTITSISCAASLPHVYYSSSSDKTFALWDSRMQQPSNRIRFKEEVRTFCVNSSDNLLVVGEEDEIGFYDLRSLSDSSSKPRSLGRYSDVHSDVVTHLSFSPMNSNILVSAGEDGLLAVYALDAPAEEDAVISILNTDCAVNRLGFFGSNYEGIYCLSTIETATLWHFPSAQRISFFPTVREQLSVDYLVDCLFDTSSQQLFMMVGNHDGLWNFAKVEPGTIEHSSSKYHTNNATLRCICSPSQVRPSPIDLFFTGGEDGLLSVYNAQQFQTHRIPVADMSADQVSKAIAAPTVTNEGKGVTGGPSRVGKVVKKNRYSPY
jgi:WD40 repeat protein